MGPCVGLYPKSFIVPDLPSKSKSNNPKQRSIHYHHHSLREQREPSSSNQNHDQINAFRHRWKFHDRRDIYSNEHPAQVAGVRGSPVSQTASDIHAAIRVRMLMSTDHACDHDSRNCSKLSLKFCVRLKTDYSQTQTVIKAVQENLPFKLKAQLGDLSTVYLQPLIRKLSPTLNTAVKEINIKQPDSNAPIFFFTPEGHLSSADGTLGWVKANGWNKSLDRKLTFVKEAYAKRIKAVFPKFHIEAESEGGQWHYKVVNQEEQDVFWTVRILSSDVAISDEEFIMVAKRDAMKEFAEQHDMKYEELQLFAEPVP
jgi:hypothetical protein